MIYVAAPALIGAFNGDPEVVHFGVNHRAVLFFAGVFSLYRSGTSGIRQCIDSDDRHALRLVSVPGKLYYRRCSFYSRYPRGIPGVPADLEHQFRHFPVSVFAGEMGVWV